jgi:TolB-like protein/Flp pilus assembly protein TadD
MGESLESSGNTPRSAQDAGHLRAFGGVRFNAHTGELQRDGRTARLTPKAAAVLTALLEEAPGLVTKKQLINRVWGGRAISDEALTSCILELRRALNDDARNPRYIETRHRRGYRLLTAIAAANMSSASSAARLPFKPSIAVLPFQNMSGDPEQEYFTDGMVEDIITALSRFKELFVIARNSSFTYKGKAVNIKQVGSELGVRYVLEGSVRKAANRLRISGQLIDAATSDHLWADHFDGVLEDVFELQDRMTSSVVRAIAPKLQQAEIKRAMHKPTESLDAYDCYLRAVASYYRATTQSNREACEEALQLSYRAIELDPEYSSAYGLAVLCYCRRFLSRWMADRVQEIAEAQRLARRVVDLGHDDALALGRIGIALAFLVDDLDEARGLIDRALALNPNLALAWVFGGWVRNYLGDTESAIKHFMNFIRLSPRDPHIFASYHGMAVTYFCSSDYDQASAWAEKALAEVPNHTSVLRTAAAADALAGRLARAQKWARRARELDPAFRISDMKDRFRSRRPEPPARYEEGLRIAGFPE